MHSNPVAAKNKKSPCKPFGQSRLTRHVICCSCCHIQSLFCFGTFAAHFYSSSRMNLSINSCATYLLFHWQKCFWPVLSFFTMQMRPLRREAVRQTASQMRSDPHISLILTFSIISNIFAKKLDCLAAFGSNLFNGGLAETVGFHLQNTFHITA